MKQWEGWNCIPYCIFFLGLYPRRFQGKHAQLFGLYSRKHVLPRGDSVLIYPAVHSLVQQ